MIAHKLYVYKAPQHLMFMLFMLNASKGGVWQKHVETEVNRVHVQDLFSFRTWKASGFL